MIDAFMMGIGFGLSFWCVLIPAAFWLFQTPKDETFNTKLEAHWKDISRVAVLQSEQVQRIADSISRMENDGK